MQISETILLEPIAEHHAEPAFALIENNRAHLKTWLTWVDFIQSAEDFRNFIKGAKQRMADKQEASYMIVHEGKVAGRAGLYYLDHQHKSGAIGYWLGKEFQSKGLVSLACKEIIKYGFTILALNRIEIKCAVTNYKSQAISERLGFTKEGILREAEQVNGHFHDLYLYSLIKKEWEKTLV